MEYSARHFGGPLLFKASTPGHFLDELPVDIATRIGDTGNAGTQSYFNHFLHWEGPVAEGAAGGWLLSGVTGAATIVHNATRGGGIVLTADGTASCNPTLQLGNTAAHMPFRYVVGKRLWLASKLRMLTVASTEFFFGFGTTDTQPTVTNTFPSDGIFWEKAASATKIDFHARKDGTSTERTQIGSTLVDATDIILGIHVDPQGNIMPYQNMSPITASRIAAGTANIPSAAGDTLGFMIGFLGASLTVTLDWLLIGQEL